MLPLVTGEESEILLTKTRIRAGAWEGQLSGPTDKPDIEVVLLEQKLPGTRVAVYTLRPSIAREHLMPEQKRVNAFFKKYCKIYEKMKKINLVISRWTILVFLNLNIYILQTAFIHKLW